MVGKSGQPDFRRFAAAALIFRRSDAACWRAPASGNGDDVNAGPCSDLGERLYVADRLGEDIAWACQPAFVALADRRAAEAQGNRRPLGPVGDLARRSAT